MPLINNFSFPISFLEYSINFVSVGFIIFVCDYRENYGLFSHIYYASSFDN